MGEVAEITAADLEFTHKGKTYRMSPTTPADLGRLELWAESQPLDRARRQIETLGDAATPDIRSEIIRDAREEAKNTRAGSPGFQALVASIQGITHLLYLSLRPHHPEIKESEVLEIMSEPGALQEFEERLDHVSGLNKKKATKRVRRTKRR